MKIIAKVPKDTLPFECGERLMACEVTDDFSKLLHCDDFFKTAEEAKTFTNKHPEYRWKSRNSSNSSED
jgi:hypothetical protein